MADNTQVNTGTGDFVRDIDRSGVKTQVIQLDVGGRYAESLVNPFNPVPTSDTSASAAQTSDAPTFVTLTGDPSGDFAGVNILEKLVDDSGDLKMAVRVVNPPGKFDAQGAQIASDAIGPINFSLLTSGQSVTFDTTGYQSIYITVPNVGGFSGATATSSNDGVIFSGVLGYISAAQSSPSSTLTSNGNFIFPVTGKFFRITLTGGSGSAVAYLRNIPALNTAPIMPQNIAQIGGASVATAGLGGVTSVGGPTANAIAPTANPNLIAGIDSGTAGTLLGVPLTRRILTDNAGRLRNAAESAASSFQQTPALNVQDTTQQEGQTVAELLAQALLEMRIQNELMAALPRNLYNAFQSLQLAPTNQTSFAGFSSDEPAAFRADPTYFIQ